MRYVCQGQSKDACLSSSFVALSCAPFAGVGVTTEAAPMAHLQSLLGECGGLCSKVACDSLYIVSAAPEVGCHVLPSGMHASFAWQSAAAAALR